jgi:hypothetical protein
MEQEIKNDWSIPDEDGNIDVPEELVPLFNKIGMQLRFHTISGKNEILTIAHIVQQSQAFFKNMYEAKKCK